MMIFLLFCKKLGTIDSKDVEKYRTYNLNMILDILFYIFNKNSNTYYNFSSKRINNEISFPIHGQIFYYLFILFLSTDVVYLFYIYHNPIEFRQKEVFITVF